MAQATQPKRPEAVPVVTELLTVAYLMELETVANYLAASVNLDGIRAQESHAPWRPTWRRSSAMRAGLRNG
jgi:hypothetical protein